MFSDGPPVVMGRSQKAIVDLAAHRPLHDLLLRYLRAVDVDMHDRRFRVIHLRAGDEGRIGIKAREIGLIPLLLSSG